MNFAHPQQLAWLLLLLVLAFFLWSRERLKGGLIAQFLAHPMLARLASGYNPRRAYLVLTLQMLGLGFLLVALAGPQWGSEVIKVEREGLDVLFAVDCSRSMLAEDPAPNRMAVAQRELGELMKKLQGNRLGLVGFAGAAFIFCPLTLDSSATQLFLEQLNENAIPTQGTAIGEAIRVGLTVFPKEEKKSSKVMILLTDGEDHKSDPLGAAREAAKQGVTIYTVGIGSPEGKEIPERLPDGTIGGVIHDNNGKPVVSKLGEKTLQEVAQLTGGKYLHIGSDTDSLQPIVASVLAGERKKLESEMRLRYQARFQIFVAAGLALLVLAQLTQLRRSA